MLIDAILFKRQGAVHLRTAAGAVKVRDRREESDRNTDNKKKKNKEQDRDEERQKRDGEEKTVNERGKHADSPRDLASDSVFRPPVAGGLNTPL